MTDDKRPSVGALEVAKELLEDILNEADVGGPRYAPCFRDCLADNLEWVTLKIAEALDSAADGRPLRVGPDGTY